jgi:quinol monooxygenase YgiN
MIIRIFRAKIRQGQVSAFKRMVQEQSIPWLESSDGMLDYFPGEPFSESDREFVMISIWRDIDALKSFAGTDWENPVVTQDEAPLVEAMSANHYNKFEQTKQDR